MPASIAQLGFLPNLAVSPSRGPRCGLRPSCWLPGWGARARRRAAAVDPVFAALPAGRWTLVPRPGGTGPCRVLAGWWFLREGGTTSTNGSRSDPCALVHSPRRPCCARCDGGRRRWAGRGGTGRPGRGFVGMAPFMHIRADLSRTALFVAAEAGNRCRYLVTPPGRGSTSAETARSGPGSSPSLQTRHHVPAALRSAVLHPALMCSKRESCCSDFSWAGTGRLLRQGLVKLYCCNLVPGRRRGPRTPAAATERS